MKFPGDFLKSLKISEKKRNESLKGIQKATPWDPEIINFELVLKTSIFLYAQRGRMKLSIIHRGTL